MTTLIAPTVLPGLLALTATHPFAGIALAVIIICWPVLRWALKLWFEGAFPLPSPSGLGARALSPIEEIGRPGRTIPFIARPAEKPI